MEVIDWALSGMKLHHFESDDELELLKVIRKFAKGCMITEVNMKLQYDEDGEISYFATVVYC